MHPTQEASTIDDDQFQREATNIVEALVNLTYLMCEEAEHPEKVRQYGGLSEERLRAMAQLLKQKFRYDFSSSDVV